MTPNTSLRATFLPLKHVFKHIHTCLTGYSCGLPSFFCWHQATYFISHYLLSTLAPNVCSPVFAPPHVSAFSNAIANHPCAHPRLSLTRTLLALSMDVTSLLSPSHYHTALTSSSVSVPPHLPPLRPPLRLITPPIPCYSLILAPRHSLRS